MKVGENSTQNFKRCEILLTRNTQTNYSRPNENLSTETTLRKSLKTKFGIYYVQRPRLCAGVIIEFRPPMTSSQFLFFC